METEANRKSVKEEGEEDEDELSTDWVSLFELSVLCPASFRGAGDGDLDRVYAQCEQGCVVTSEVFS